MSRVLVVADFFPPSARSGGARSLASLVGRLGGRFDFRVVCRNHDVGDLEPYRDVPSGRWVETRGARVFYLRRGDVGAASLRERIREAAPDLIHLNSVFSRLALRVLALRRLGLLGGIPLLLAPQGELSEGALDHHRVRKRAVLGLLVASGACRGLVWKASDARERDEVLRVAGGDAEVRIAPEPLPAEIPPPAGPRPPKEPGRLRLVFLGRVCAKKNLPHLLDALDGVGGHVEVDVRGPIEDRALWDRCVRKARGLAPHVGFSYGGPVAHEEVTGTLARSHVFVLPSLGENFGHAILEALAAGLPVLLSDRTPWRGLAPRRAGWDLPLEDVGAFREVLRTLVAWDDRELGEWSRGARRLALDVLSSDVSAAANEAVLREAVSFRGRSS